MTHRIKPLVWVRREEHFHAASTVVGMAYITEYLGMRLPFKLDILGIGQNHFPTIEAAKESAQQVQVLNVSAALEPTDPLADAMKLPENVAEMVRKLRHYHINAMAFSDPKMLETKAGQLECATMCSCLEKHVLEQAADMISALAALTKEGERYGKTSMAGSCCCRASAW